MKSAARLGERVAERPGSGPAAASGDPAVVVSVLVSVLTFSTVCRPADTAGRLTGLGTVGPQ